MAFAKINFIIDESTMVWRMCKRVYIVSIRDEVVRFAAASNMQMDWIVVVR